jgi:hypothetical protein
MEMQIVVSDIVGPRIAAFGDERNQSRILNFIIARVGREYRKKLRASYLSGQMIGSGPGPDHLKNRIMVYKKKRDRNVYIIGEKAKMTNDAANVRLANIFEHPGGYTIVPKKKKVLFFVTPDGHWNFAKRVEGKSRPFMSASYSAFPWSPTISAEADKVFELEKRKSGLAE